MAFNDTLNEISETLVYTPDWVLYDLLEDSPGNYSSRGMQVPHSESYFNGPMSETVSKKRDFLHITGEKTRYSMDKISGEERARKEMEVFVEGHNASIAQLAQTYKEFDDYVDAFKREHPIAYGTAVCLKAIKDLPHDVRMLAWPARLKIRKAKGHIEGYFRADESPFKIVERVETDFQDPYNTSGYGGAIRYTEPNHRTVDVKIRGGKVVHSKPPVTRQQAKMLAKGERFSMDGIEFHPFPKADGRIRYVLGLPLKG